jgi:NAD(P)-dependent dehydrogenase (short-subunit alcohol dehydrogenase family)
VVTRELNLTAEHVVDTAKDGIRVKAVAPGVIDTPLHKEEPKNALRSLNRMGVVSSVKDRTDAVMYLTEATTMTGQILYVDGGAHFGRW